MQVKCYNGEHESATGGENVARIREHYLCCILASGKFNC